MKNEMIRFVLLLSVVFWNFVTLCHAQDETPSKRRALVLHSYLLMPSWAKQIQDEAEAHSLVVDFAAADSLELAELNRRISDAELVLLDVAHESVLESVATKTIDAIQDANRPYVLIGDLDSVREGKAIAIGSQAGQSDVSRYWAERVKGYYRYGGTDNLKHLVSALAKDPKDADGSELPEPVLIPDSGFYHPSWSQIESELSVVQQRLTEEDQPIVAIAINRATVSACDTIWLDALINALGERGLSSYAFFGPRQNPDRFTRMTCTITDEGLDPVVDLIINSVLVFRPQDRKLEMEKIGIPVLQTLPARNRSVEQWQDSTDGLPLADISYYYASSELAGMVDPMLITARDSQTQALRPIDIQIDGIADRAAAISRLQQSSRNERRVAVFVYNYPPGENNFGASFLNVPKSLERTFTAMSQAGYSVESTDAATLTSRLQQCMRGLYRREALKELASDADTGFVSLKDYQTWFQTLPAETRKSIVDYWGSPESMAIDLDDNDKTRGFLIPCVALGNVFVMPQPLRHELTRSTDADVRKQRINHHSVVPLSHTYLASYLFVKTTFDAHAVIHFGTHGTQEWAPGKQRALAVVDEAMLAIGDLPNFYPYIMDNLGEATTAKRRGRATMVGHLTPMFSPSGFRPGLHDMHVVMHDWETVDPGPVKKETERQLIEEFVKHKLDKDLGWSPERIAEDFEGFMEVLHPFLDDVAQSAQPQGLAVFGEVPDEERRFGMVMQMLRRRLIDSLGEDIDEVFLIDSDKVKNSRPGRWLRMALEDPEAASRLDLREIDRLDTSSHTSVPNRAEDKQLDQQELLALAKEAQRLDRVLASNPEIDSLLKALDGSHVPSGYGGDPVRNPDSLPTGRNLYGFDPVRVPTQQSWKIGVGVLENWLETYRVNHDGSYPTQLAFTLWAGETMRHHGVMEAQVLYALGVQPKWDSSGRMKGIELIPAETLGRPRIDVLANVTGSYRDQFPHLMDWIDQAVVTVAMLETSKGNDSTPGIYPNYVSQHAERLREELVAKGISETEASRNATARVFSNESGTYGTGLNNAVYHSDLWDTQDRGGGDQEMSTLFLNRMGHAYGKDLDGVAASELFAKQIENIEAVFLPRSSNTYGVLTSDDPFAYLGGFALAARTLGGKSPELVVQNLRDPEEVIVDSVDTAIAKEMQTRYLHPQWIRGQQNEGYSGTLQVLKATQFLWGWQAMQPNSVREDQWQSLMDVYIKDEYELGTRQWFEESNHQALAQMTERMLEAIRLNYWTPTQENQQLLARVYQEASDASGLMEKNQSVLQFVEENFPKLESKDSPAEPVAPESIASSGSPEDSIPSPAEADASSESESVEGIELRAVEEEPEAIAASNRITTLAVIGMMALVLVGALVQLFRSSTKKGGS